MNAYIERVSPIVYTYLEVIPLDLIYTSKHPYDDCSHGGVFLSRREAILIYFLKKTCVFMYPILLIIFSGGNSSLH